MPGDRIMVQPRAIGPRLQSTSLTSRQDSELFGGECIEESGFCGGNRISGVNRGGGHISGCVRVYTALIVSGSSGPDCISASSTLDDYYAMCIPYRDTGHLAISIDTFNRAQAYRDDTTSNRAIPPVPGVRLRACDSYGNHARNLPPCLASPWVCINVITVYLVLVINLVSERSEIYP